MARWEVGFIVGVTIFWTTKSHFEKLISVCILVFIEASIAPGCTQISQSIHRVMSHLIFLYTPSKHFSYLPIISILICCFVWMRDAAKNCIRHLAYKC